MRIRWTIPAAEDLAGIHDYVQETFPRAVGPTMRNIRQRILSLGVSPYLGRAGKFGTRELPLPPLPYIVIYSVEAEVVEILHIYHGAQDWKN